MGKILIIASVASMVDQFLKPNLLLLQSMGHKVEVACNFLQGNNCDDQKIALFKEELEKSQITYYQIDFSRSVYNIRENYKAYKQVLQIFNKNQYEFIHCHTPIGSVIGRYVAHKKGVKVIYTAHGFHFYKGAPRKNWLIYYTVEKILSKYTDTLITINQEDYQLAKKLKAKRVELVPGVGITTSKFALLEEDKKQMRKRLDVKDDDVMLLSIGELSQRKNHEAVIRAISLLNNKKISYFIIGIGSKEEYLKNIAIELGVVSQIHFLGYRKDITAICNAADIFVFPSLQEGLPVALMEAMASGLPVVCSRIRGNDELVEDNKGGYLVPPLDSNEIAKAIETLIKDGSIRASMGDYNKKFIEKFDIDNVNICMKQIYEHIAMTS